MHVDKDGIILPFLQINRKSSIAFFEVVLFLPYFYTILF